MTEAGGAEVMSDGLDRALTRLLDEFRDDPEMQAFARREVARQREIQRRFGQRIALRVCPCGCWQRTVRN